MSACEAWSRKRRSVASLGGHDRLRAVERRQFLHFARRVGQRGGPRIAERQQPRIRRQRLVPRDQFLERRRRRRVRDRALFDQVLTPRRLQGLERHLPQRPVRHDDQVIDVGQAIVDRAEQGVVQLARGLGESEIA
jgi:hypothetical protein